MGSRQRCIGVAGFLTRLRTLDAGRSGALQAGLGIDRRETDCSPTEERRVWLTRCRCCAAAAEVHARTGKSQHRRR